MEIKTKFDTKTYVYTIHDDEVKRLLIDHITVEFSTAWNRILYKLIVDENDLDTRYTYRVEDKCFANLDELSERIKNNYLNNDK